MKETLLIPTAQDGAIWPYRASGKGHPKHHHEELELNLVLEGQATYLVRERRLELHEGSLLWLFPAQEHVLVQESADFAMWVVVFRQRMIRRHCREEPFITLARSDPEGDFIGQLPPGSARRLGQVIEQARQAPLALLNAALAYLLLSAWSAMEESTRVQPRRVHPCVERAARLLRDSQGSDSLPDIAARVGLSPSRLSRLFRAQTGLTITDFRNRQRMERFLRLYETMGGHRNLLWCCHQAGFGSYAQFHRVFKQMHGRGPRGWLKPPTHDPSRE